MPPHEPVKLCTTCWKRPRAARLAWCREYINTLADKSRQQRRAIGKAHRKALQDWQRPPTAPAVSRSVEAALRSDDEG